MSVPALRFKDDDGSEFPDWDTRTLEDILEYEQPTKYLVSSVEYNDSYETPVLTAGKTFILGYTDEKSGIFNKNLPVIIFDDFTTAFKFVSFPFKAKSSAMKILKIKDTANSIKYVYEAMQQIDFPSGDEHKRYWISEYSKISIPLATKKEQTKIANFFTAVDEKINQLTQKHELLNKYKKGVMQKIFSQELRFKDGDGSDFPEWSTFTISEILIKNSNKNKDLEFNLVQSVSNKHGFINQDELFEDRVIASKDLSNYYIIKQRAFAYNPSRLDVGSLAYKRDDRVSVVSPLYVSFYAKSDFIFDEYLINWFDNNEFKKQMTNSFEGGVRNTLSYDSLSKMIISLPNLKEQTKIANFLTAIDEKITSTQSQLELIKQYKQGLLQQMFV